MKNSIGKTFKSKLIFCKYSLKYLIAKGTTGEVYLGKNILDNKEYALKIEKAIKGDSLLKQEAFTLLLLKGPGLPSVITFGQSNRYHILVENLLGESIYNIWRKKNKKINLKDTCMFAIQALERLEYVHSKNYLHRDVKPGNFLVGNPDKSQIYLIDFGNARKYRSSRTGKHLPFANNCKMYGTTIFLSLNVLKGIEQTRKDELESLGLVIIYLYQGFLPWSNLKCKDLYQGLCIIKKLKLKITNEELCKDLPKEIYDYMNYVKNMNFNDNPDYRYLKSCFLNILKNIGEKNDLIFSWVDKDKIPRKINSRNNSKSLQKIYKNIFLAHSNKVVPISNTNINLINPLDKKLLNQNYKSSDVLELKEEKMSTYYEDNNINNIYLNNNEKKIDRNQKIIHINLEDNNKRHYKQRALNYDNNLNKKSITTYMDNKKLKKIKLTENKGKKNLSNLNSKGTIQIQKDDKIRNSINNKSNLYNKIISNKNFIDKEDNKKINKRTIKGKIIFNNFGQSSNNKNNDNKINNCININNININKLPDNNYTYVTIFKSTHSPKLNIISNNEIIKGNMSEIKELQIKRFSTEVNNQNNTYQKPSNFYYKPSLYKSIFTPKSDLNKDISDISKKYSQQISQKKKEKAKLKIIPKTDKKKFVIKPRNLKAKLFSNSKNKIYNSLIYKNHAINFSKNSKQNLSLNTKDK